jgi:hypothetical protein
MVFSEGDRDWQPIPAWARFLIAFGYRWPRDGPRRRRIALISMPCDSAAAGLVTLGTLIRDLANPDANDIAGHYDALMRHAQQYLESCRDCDLKCHPQVKQCGHIAEASGRVRSERFPRRTYLISNRTSIQEGQLVFFYRDKIYSPNRQFVTDWYLDGHPLPQLETVDGQLPSDPYQQIIEEGQILPENLRKTYSGLCLASRAAGESATREMFASIRFRESTAEFRLGDLLTVHGWSTASISRVSFFNVRTGTVDRTSGSPALVVADGDPSFLKVAGRPEFQQSDILGVISRTLERDALEAVGNKMQALRQWYAQDNEALARMTPSPLGISVTMLKRR